MSRAKLSSLTLSRRLEPAHAVAVATILLIFQVGCEADDTSSDHFADALVEFTPAASSSFGHDRLPEVVLGAPGGLYDVASLGCEGSIVIGFDAPGIIDGPGVDLIVFENPFSEDFPEPGEVSVSDDGIEWWVFPCDPVTLVGCAGVTPTLALPGSGLDPTDPAEAGGDGFDLSTLVDGPAQVEFVRVRDRSREHWEPLGGLSYCDPGNQGAGGFDLDAIVSVH